MPGKTFLLQEILVKNFSKKHKVHFLKRKLLREGNEEHISGSQSGKFHFNLLLRVRTSCGSRSVGLLVIKVNRSFALCLWVNACLMGPNYTLRNGRIGCCSRSPSRHSQGHHPRIFEPNWIHCECQTIFRALHRKCKKWRFHSDCGTYAQSHFQLLMVDVPFLLPALDRKPLSTYLSSYWPRLFYLHNFRHWPATCDHCYCCYQSTLPSRWS